MQGPNRRSCRLLLTNEQHPTANFPSPLLATPYPCICYVGSKLHLTLSPQYHHVVLAWARSFSDNTQPALCLQEVAIALTRACHIQIRKPPLPIHWRVRLAPKHRKLNRHKRPRMRSSRVMLIWPQVVMVIIIHTLIYVLCI